LEEVSGVVSKVRVMAFSSDVENVLVMLDMMETKKTYLIRVSQIHSTVTRQLDALCVLNVMPLPKMGGNMSTRMVTFRRNEKTNTIERASIQPMLV
jgi:hypothetical protein